MEFGDGRHALTCGSQKLDLHQAGSEFQPCAARPVPGSAELCFLGTTALERVVGHLEKCVATIEAGPARRTGATGPIRSIYLRDPDGKLLEIASALRE